MTIDRIKARHTQDVADADSHILQLDRSVPDKGISTSTELETELARIQAALQATRG